MPMTCLRSCPNLVAAHVTANTVSREANAPGPTLANNAKHTAAPARAPERETPRTTRPMTAKATVVARIRANRVPESAHHAAELGLKFNAIKCIANETKFYHNPHRVESH